MTTSLPFLDELADVSARIGNDPLLVQGPGGNSSLKIGDELWVKASGVWLAQARQRQIFVGLALAPVRAAVAAGQAADFGAARLPASTTTLRPSIETALHALMPHAAVVHAHAVNSMALAILADGRARAAAALDGVHSWAWIPYCQPGAPLAAAIAAALAVAPADVLLLANHGVVVGAATPRLAEALLRDVEHRLALPLRRFADPSTPAAGDDDYEAVAAIAGFATDPEICATIAAGPWFPDQIVFMGGAVPVLQDGEALAGCAARTRAATGVVPVLILEPGAGALARRDRSASAAAVIAGLFEVARRLPHGARVTALPASAVPALLGWEAETYRLGLAQPG